MNPPPDSHPDPAPARGRRRLGWLVGGWLLALLFLDARLPPPASQQMELAVDMDASTASAVQVFFNTGKGFSAQESVNVPVAAGTAAQTLVFPIPPASIQTLRLDPLTLPGTVHLHRAVIRRASDHEEVQTLDLRQITGMNEIARLTPQPDGVEIVTTPDSVDSQVRLPFTGVLDTQPSLSDRVVRWVGIDVSLTMLALLVAGLGIFLVRKFGSKIAGPLGPLAGPVLWLDARFSAWAARLSRPEIAALDRWVFWFFGGCALLFGGMAALGLHGSSLDEFGSGFPWSEVRTVPIYGQVRGIRSDEWALETPAFLNQAFRRQPYAAHASSIGRQNAALLQSIPCKDWTQVFRPQYWAFQILPFPAAFAIFWQAKGFLLLTGVFSLLLVLTGGRSGLSTLGALWMFFSAHTQWAYSWPSMLPEMIGCFGWTIALTMYLCVGRNRYLLAAAAAACVFCAVNFAMCFYPPHQIPFALFGALLLAAWLWTHRAFALRGDLVWRHMLALAGCWLAVAVVMGGYLLEVKDGLAIAVHTVYPGRRVSSGGGIPLETLLSQLLDFWKNDLHVPAAQNNICESTGYLWLLPVTLLPWGRGRTGSNGVLAACWIAAGIVAAWMIFPIPPSVGRWLLLDHVPASRCLPGLGLINVVGVVVALGLRRGRETLDADLPPESGRWGGRAAVLLVVAALLGLMNTACQGFFELSEMLLGIVYITVLVVCLLEAQPAFFAAVLLVPLMLAFGLVNPVDRGVDVVTRSALYRTVQADPRLREGRWLVFSREYMVTGFVVATGADVFNSFKVLPNLSDMAVFDPTGRFFNSYNQSGHMVVRPLPEGQPCAFDNPNIGWLQWSVSPLDPGLRQVGIRYLAFDEPPPPALAAKLKRIAPDVPKLFIYELP